MAWCHGAPGIGLSRVRAVELLPAEPEVREDAAVALRTTATGVRDALDVPTTSFSLCHGVAGNAELLLYAGTSLPSPEHRAMAEHVGRVGAMRFEDAGEPWPSGVNGGGDTPNLMLGTAGIGYHYLRLADPERVPPVVIVLADADARA